MVNVIIKAKKIMAKLVQLKKQKEKVYTMHKPLIATAFLQDYISMPEGIQNISLGVIQSNTSKLTLSDGGIKIGKGISKIRACGGCFIDTPNVTGYNWLRISKNSRMSPMATCLVAGWTTYKSATISPSAIYDVVEGDIIYLTNDVSGAGTPYSVRSEYANTWLQVEVVSCE